MKKALVIILGVAAGAAVTALVASSRGKVVRSTISRKASKIKNTLGEDIEKKARHIHDSGVVYS